MKKTLIVIGGGLSGLAAAIRFARYSNDVLIIEKHSRIGGLNSYYYRNSILLETGLHAVTNYAPPEQKNAPLNLLLRQLKLRRKKLILHQQLRSEINFVNQKNLFFSNDIDLLTEDIKKKFPHCLDNFITLREAVSALDVFSPSPFRSARKYVQEIIGDILLTDMLLCPLMYYGSSIENDMDLSQFGIMFQAIYLQGMHRPSGTIKDFLDMLLQHYQNLGGSIKLSTGVKSIICEKKKITGVELKNGDVIHCDHLLSSVGLNETYELLGADKRPTNGDRLGFVESIFVLPKNCKPKLSTNKTIIFYNTETSFNYRRPKTIVDFNSGVVCFPAHFHDRDDHEYFEIRSTHLANYHGWLSLYQDYNKYTDAKATVSRHSCSILNNLIGNFQDEIIFHDTFTPVTISRFTGKNEGAIYGSPVKVKDGNVGYDNLHLIGTDQGFLGIIGSMLSGVSMVNQHVLPKI